MSNSTLIAVDIGNSRLKFGLFERAGSAEAPAAKQLPEPVDTLGLPHDRPGSFDVEQLAAWCGRHKFDSAEWLVASVHRGTGERLAAAVAELGRRAGRNWPVRFLVNRDVPLVIHLDKPDLLGIDRVVAAHAVNRVRDPGRAAVVVDMGTAITVDLVAADGSFVGGAILPGMDIAARALAEYTDVLPRVSLEHLAGPPEALAKAAVPAIESGLFWGAVGAVRELAGRFAAELPAPPEVFLTGGASRLVAEALAADQLSVRYEPNLVLSGIAILD